MVEIEATGTFRDVRWKNNNKTYDVIKTALHLHQNTHIKWKWAEVNTNSKISGIYVGYTYLISTAFQDNATTVP